MTAVRSPEYFPRIEYCALMFEAEWFVIADTFPFSRQSWHNRTKIRPPDEQGRQRLTVPRKHGATDKALNALELDASTFWARTR
ncbi:MAG: WbqC family protein [Bacteroidetes bacterium]|nr:WbqC family protein [Bacteroidota bacterium]